MEMIWHEPDLNIDHVPSCTLWEKAMFISSQWATVMNYFLNAQRELVHFTVFITSSWAKKKEVLTNHTNMQLNTYCSTVEAFSSQGPKYAICVNVVMYTWYHVDMVSCVSCFWYMHMLYIHSSDRVCLAGWVRRILISMPPSVYIIILNITLHEIIIS